MDKMTIIGTDGKEKFVVEGDEVIDLEHQTLTDDEDDEDCDTTKEQSGE